MYYLIGIFILYVLFIITGSRKQRMKIKIKKTITYKNVNVISENIDEIEFKSLENEAFESNNFTVQTLRIKSEYVDEEMTYLAIVPKSYNPEKSYPAIFFTSWITR